MNDRETEQQLRAWLQEQRELPAPGLLRTRVLSIPEHDYAVAGSRLRLSFGPWAGGHRRALEIAIALVLLALLGVLASVSLTGGRPLLGLTPVPTKPPATSQPSPSATAAPHLLAPLGYDASGTIAFSRTDPQTQLEMTELVDPSGSRESTFQVGLGWPNASSLTGFSCCGVFRPGGGQIALGYGEINAFRGSGAWQTATVVNLDGSPATSIPVVCGGCASVVGLNYLPRAWSAERVNPWPSRVGVTRTRASMASNWRRSGGRPTGPRKSREIIGMCRWRSRRMAPGFSSFGSERRLAAEISLS